MNKIAQEYDHPTKIKKRPSVVVIATILQIIQGGILLVYGLYQLEAYGWEFSATSDWWRYIPLPLFESLTSGLILVVLGIFMLIVAIAFWFMKSWAWLLAMSMQGVGLFVGLIDYLRHRPHYLGMLLGILIFIFLNHRDVQHVFHRESS
ncbi:MAG: hypothetical protein ACK2TV_05250 [Anaerolineales bacterium]